MPSKKPVALTKSKIYSDFTAKRDRVLEKILNVHLSAIDAILSKLRAKVFTMKNRQAEFSLASDQIITIAKRLRAEVYFFAHISEAEAIGRTLERPHRYRVHTKEHVKKPMHDGVTLDARVYFEMTKLFQKVENAFHLSHIMGATREETRERVLRAFPPSRPQPKTVRRLHRQAKKIDQTTTFDAGDETASMSYGFADADLWQNVLDDYFSEQLPDSIFKRGPEDKAIFYDVTTQENEERYAWAIEQEVTEDFVRSVREGTNDAATENGISDLEWIAILDSNTDECCLVRDGKSSTEIETALDNGDIDENECDAIVAPAHFNCRCKSVAMSSDIPDAPTVDYGGFDDWLTSQGNAGVANG